MLIRLTNSLEIKENQLNGRIQRNLGTDKNESNKFIFEKKNNIIKFHLKLSFLFIKNKY